jgi:hypothetical protein
MYHYADSATLKNHATGANGVWNIEAHLDGGVHYLTPESLTSQAEAIGRLQLPLKKLPDGIFVEEPTKGRFKVIFQTQQISENCRIPRSNVHSVETGGGSRPWLESVAKDNPQRGPGGGIQFVTPNSLGQATVLDLKTGIFVQDDAHLLQLLQDFP